MLGRHSILECYGCEPDILRNQNELEGLLVDCAVKANATVLHTYFHKFDQGEGVTGVIALAESHISVHTWPEYGYMAIDVFMCGDCDPEVSIRYIIEKMNIRMHSLSTLQRGNFY